MPKILTGIVRSNKMLSTVGVSVNRVWRHPKYHKILRRKINLLAHTELKDLKIGDTVRIQETKPYSKNTYFKVLEIVGKQPESEKPIKKEKTGIKKITKKITKK